MAGLEGTALGRYRLVRQLGHGGMSEVYLAYDELMHRDVAIKVVSSTHADYVERFQREAKAIGNLHHDHILPAFDYGELKHWLYLVMPYIEHETLSEFLERRGYLSLEEAGEMLQQIASALQYAHERGIVHRDIKPSNILLRDDHHSYLADFGLAKPMNSRGSVTQTGVLLGTPEYMAPELADGPASMSSDLYALAVLLYQMVTGQLPFTGDTSLAVFLKQMYEQPIPPSRLNPAIPPGVEKVILRALDKDPRRRYQTPRGLAHAYLRAVSAAKYEQDAVPRRTATWQNHVVVHDSNEMPLLHYEISEVSEAKYEPPQDASNVLAEPRLQAPLDATPIVTSVSDEDDKLVLPAYPLNANSAAANSLEETIIQAPARSTPPLPGQRRARPHSARYNRNIFVVTSFMGISFLLIIMSVILFAVSDYNSNRLAGRTTTTTTQAANTSSTSGTQPKDTPSPEASATRQTPEQPAVATANAITSGTPLLEDDLSSSIIGSWYVDGSFCVFIGGTYHVRVKQPDYLVPCESNILTYDNAALQVDVTLLSGSDAGLVFRANDQQFYDFEIDNQGEFFFRRHDPGANGGAGTYTYLIPKTANSAIARDKQKNTLLVIAKGSDFKLFINDDFVGEVQDSTYTGGQVGFAAGTLPSVNSAEASFSNFKAFQVS